MKHIVIFLNYSQSRLDNPVYRLFATESLYRRNVSLLFLNKPIDERELQHEVTELRKKQKTLDDITFHVCADFVRNNEGAAIVSTIMLIRKLYKANVESHYPIFVYGQMPHMLNTDEMSRKSVWRNLVQLNNAVADHLECRLLTNVYLYNDESQRSLAEFIFSVTRCDISFERLSVRLPVQQGDLFGLEGSGKESLDFPPIFGSFNTSSISYPEYELRAHLRQYFLLSALRYALPEVNETPIELCNDESQRILSFVPIQPMRLCLQEDSFLNLSYDETTQWPRVDSFWSEGVELQMQGLSDYPREDWLTKIRQRADLLFQSRFRDIGVDHFFLLEGKKTIDYCNLLKSIITQEFNSSIKTNALTPEAQKTMVRGVVNVLQQKVIEIQNLKADTEETISQIENELADIAKRWHGLNIFNRIMRKDSIVLESFREALTRLMIKKTLVPGCDFAIKLLNELIPGVSALIERCDECHRILSETMRQVESFVSETNPSEKFSIFGNKELSQTHIAIEADKDSLLEEYQRIMLTVYDNGTMISSGDDLLAMIRESVAERVDSYLDKRIDACSIPPLLGMSVCERINRNTSSIGGIVGYIESMKRTTPLSISIKKSCSVPSKFFVISSDEIQEIEGVEHLPLEDISHLQLLHVRYGMTLQDLDGFAGQRMFVEPSIF